MGEQRTSGAVDRLLARSTELLPEGRPAWAVLLVQTMLTGRLMEAMAQEVLAEAGVDMTVFNIITSLWFRDSDASIGMTELESLMVVSQSGMSRAAQRGVRDGYLDKVADPADRRSSRLRLTRLGRERAEALMILLADQLAARIGPRSPAQVVGLARPAQVVSDALDTHAAAAPRRSRSSREK